tara:strand:- start:1053 stop:1208 length:156 start_codon:yes stop_codon:yes gene_type:complete
MKRLAIIGGLSMMTASGANMIWNNQQLGMNPNTYALATGGFFVVVGITYKL